MGKSPLNIAFHWHMHQPAYAPPNSSVAMLPWTRLHALKDYLDMPRYCERAGFPATFNLAPCLIEQLLGYADGTLTDEYLEIARKPLGELTAEDRRRILADFFAMSANMMARFPRLVELYEKYGDLGEGELRSISALAPDEDILDLTVLFDLAWCGEALRKEREVSALISKGRGFSPEDRARLQEKSREWIAEIIPTYKRLWDDGTIELTFNPMFHPILPLLCDTDAGRDARADCPLPEIPMKYPQDASRQIEMGLELFEKAFGRKPAGMWPSEGSVSEAMLAVLSKFPVRWISADEAILRKSRPAGGFDANALYLPWAVNRGGAKISIVFRDHRLSDNVGFDYSKMPANDAIEDFIGNLRAIWSNLPDSGEFLVSIVLDGENAWEFFPANGKDFLEGLYSRMMVEDWLSPVKIGDFIENNPPTRELEFLAPGSWIDGDFCTWIGHPEKNRAWEELARARSAVEDFVGTDKFSPAMAHVLVAEGSDWFWWFGRGGVGAGLAEFDRLFRARVEAIYRALELPPPESLSSPIITGAGDGGLKRRPFALIRPTIDGRRTNFFEWQGAGIFENAGFFGAMHGGSAFDVKKILFGFDEAQFYMRIDTGCPARDIIAEGVEFVIEISTNSTHRITIGTAVRHEVLSDDGQASAEMPPPQTAIAELIELAIPLENLCAQCNSTIGWSLRTSIAGETRERHPSAGNIECAVPPDDFEARNWIV